MLEAALANLRSAGPEFADLVATELRTVIAIDEYGRAYDMQRRAWASDFRNLARTEPHVLACQLLWASLQLRLTSEANASGAVPDREAWRQQCVDVQRRYLAQHADGEQWLEGLAAPA